MSRKRGKRTSLIAALLTLAVLTGGMGWLTYRQIRQEKRNRALIAAIKRNDTSAALAALGQGADPNTRDEPSKHLSLWQLWLNRFRGKHPAPSKANTALLVAIKLQDAVPARILVLSHWIGCLYVLTWYVYFKLDVPKIRRQGNRFKLAARCFLPLYRVCIWSRSCGHSAPGGLVAMGCCAARYCAGCSIK